MPRDVRIDQNVHRSLPGRAPRPTHARRPSPRASVTHSPCTQRWHENQRAHDTGFWKGPQKSLHPYSILPYEESQVCCLSISSEPSCWLCLIKLLYGNCLPWVSPKTKPMCLLKCPRCLRLVLVQQHTFPRDHVWWRGQLAGLLRREEIVWQVSAGNWTPPPNPVLPGQTPSGPSRGSSPRLRAHGCLCSVTCCRHVSVMAFTVCVSELEFHFCKYAINISSINDDFHTHPVRTLKWCNSHFSYIFVSFILFRRAHRPSARVDTHTYARTHIIIRHGPFKKICRVCLLNYVSHELTRI